MCFPLAGHWRSLALLVPRLPGSPQAVLTSGDVFGCTETLLSSAVLSILCACCCFQSQCCLLAPPSPHFSRVSRALQGSSSPQLVAASPQVTCAIALPLSLLYISRLRFFSSLQRANRRKVVFISPFLCPSPPHSLTSCLYFHTSDLLGLQLDFFLTWAQHTSALRGAYLLYQYT